MIVECNKCKLYHTLSTASRFFWCLQNAFCWSTLSALGPRKSKMSKLDRARASMALPPPVLQTPALPSLPELDAYTAQMAFYPPYSAQPHMQGSVSSFFFAFCCCWGFFNCEIALESDVLMNRCFFNVALCKKIMVNLKSTWKDMHLVERHGIIRLDAPVFQPRGMDIQHMHQTMQDTAVRVILPTRSIKAILKAIHATILSLNSFSLLTVSMWVKGDIHLVEGCH